MTHSPLSSSEHYRQYFIRQLGQLLEYDELGVFILVVANASMDDSILAELRAQIDNRFDYFKQQIAQSIEFPDDDLSVFLKLDELGLENIQHSRSRTAGDWSLLFNPLRSLRPARNSQQQISSLLQPFDAKAFHFNKPFLAREIIWKGQLEMLEVCLFYNKFPFADYHTLLLINASEQKPQWLNQQDINDIETFMDALSDWEQLGLAYNSLGAYASVNHQHWQMVLSQQSYPVEQLHWKHNGGVRDYPIGVQCFASVMDAWQEIDSLQQNNQPFNLFIRHHRAYLIKRKKQGELAQPAWSGGLAWSELAGHFTLTRLSDYDSLTPQMIEQQLALLKID